MSSQTSFLSWWGSCCLAAVVAWTFPGGAAAQNLRSVVATAHDLAYSPVTNRIYASVPASNAIVVIDPVAGAIVGSPLIVGSQPMKLALSDSGEFLYVGFDGASLVRRVHLPTLTIDLEIPLGTDAIRGPHFVEDMAVMPGNPDVIAVSRRSQAVFPKHAGVAIFDRGVQRPATTPQHTGANLIEFANAQRMYGLTIDSSEFGFRRLAVDSSGVTVVDVTPSLLLSTYDSDFEYAAGRVYATNGKIADPEALVVTGTFAEAAAAAKRALEPHAAQGVVFFVTRDSFVTNWVLRTFSIASQLQIGPAVALPGVINDSFDPVTLIKWGANGLALTTLDGNVWLMDDGLAVPAAPSISITSPATEPEWAMEPGTLSIGGTAADPGGTPVSIAWSNDRGGSGSMPGSATWQAANIPIAAGVNTITVTVLGSTGRTATDTITVTAAVPELTYFLAEGATGSFFDTDVAIANPNGVSAPVTISYLLEGGIAVDQSLTLAPTSRTTIRVDEVAGLENAAFSTVVRSTSGHPLVVERTMRWDGVGQYGSHTDKATAGLAPAWYFAEGSQGFFASYLLLANPNSTANVATVDWLRENEAPLRRTYPLGPGSRTTIAAGDDPELRDRSFGIVVTFATPGVAERTMYFGLPPDVLFKGGHNSAGVNAPAADWLLAEGATGPFFDTFVLIANPNGADVTATLTFLPDSGVPVVRTVTVPANGRRTINIEALDPAAPELSNVPVATRVSASAPVVVERAQYWPGTPDAWYEAHNSFGVTAAAKRWGLAEGRVGNPSLFPPAAYQTYVLLANPSPTTATATLTFLRANGTTITKTFTVGGQSRRNVQIAGPQSDVPELNDEVFGVVIDADQPIAVERAMYGNTSTQVFGSGTNATATPLP